MDYFTQRFFKRVTAPVAVIRATSVVLLVVVTTCLTIQTKAVQAQTCTGLAGWVVSVEGDLTVSGETTQMGDEFCLGEELMVGQQSRAAVRLAATQTVVRVNQNSSLMVEEADEGGTLVTLFKGIIYLFSRRPQNLSVDTPYVNAAIDGTEFVVESSPGISQVTVIEGNVRVSNTLGLITIEQGEIATARSNELPLRQTTVNPLNAAQWALHYPSIGTAENTSDRVRSAAKFLAQGDTKRAELAISGSPIDAASLSLQSIIAVTRNQTDDAIAFAQRAVNTDPGSSLAYTALSYAQQAQFDIDLALGSAMTAVQNDPTNADALARQAELQLGVDETSDALDSAREAVRVDSTNSRARTVLGFVYLVRLDTRKSKTAFLDAIALDPGDPLPRLGLGLATIRGGQLVEGREHIEVAASLDPANALIRSYLGKAYFEERQNADASEQFALAQRLDPQDPTPWFYDALLEQTLNQPVSAYEKINQALELNDNRLIYQSRLLVDKSASAGALSLARIYTDLGFEQPAINESTKSIVYDPTNYSAYRLLADSYAGRERFESARRNVMFQAALLQPMTSTAAQPYAQEANLLILPGTNPIDPAINEYSPLFDHQGFQLAGSLVAGNEQTLGNNLVLSGLHNRFVYSIGQFQYETDGFRTNSDVEHRIYHGNVQAKISQNLFFQMGFQRRETIRGDLILNTDPDEFDPSLRVNTNTTTPRLGLRWESGARSTLLISGRNIDYSFDRSSGSPDDTLNVEQESSGHEASARFTYRDNKWNHTFGADRYSLDINTLIEYNPCALEPCLLGDSTTDSEFSSFYYYVDFHRNQNLQWTLGVNYSNYDDEQLTVNDSNVDPKFGFRWAPTHTSEFRFSFSRGTKRRSVADQTLEPITLAGFNQYYDNFSGSRYANTGVAFDKTISQSTSLGLQFIHRQIGVRRLRTGEADEALILVNDSQNEETVRGYWNRILSPELSLDLSFLYERSKRDDTRTADDSPLESYPLRIETISLPVGIHYTHPSGFFAQGEVSGVYQRVTRYSDPDAGENTSYLYSKNAEHFANVNMSIGLRIPKRRMTIRFDISNLLDTSYRFQGPYVQTGATSSPRYSPKRLFVARANFSFR